MRSRTTERGGKNAKTVEEIYAPILETWRELRSGEMLIILESWTMRDEKKDRRQSMLHFWYDGGKCRLEEIHEPFTDRNGKESPRNTENTCSGCYSDTTLVWHSDSPLGGGKIAVTITDIDLTDKKSRYRLPNPGVFGLVPSSLHNCDWEKVDHMTRKKMRTEESVVRDFYKGEECWKVEYQLSSPVPQVTALARRFWVSPNQGDSIVRIQEQFKFEDDEFITAVDCKSEKDAESGLWFPRRLVWETGRLGSDPVAHEEAQVTLASLNKPLDPAVFSFKGIRSITPGLFVHRESKESDSNFFNHQTVTIDGREIHRATAIWNGEKLVSREEFEKSGKLP